MIKSKDVLKLDKDDLNLLLGYASLRLKEKVISVSLFNLAFSSLYSNH